MSEQDPQATIAILRAENEKLHKMNDGLRAKIEMLEHNSIDDDKLVNRLQREIRNMRDGVFGTSVFESHEITMTSCTCGKCGYEFYVKKANYFIPNDGLPRYCPYCDARLVRDE